MTSETRITIMKTSFLLFAWFLSEHTTNAFTPIAPRPTSTPQCLRLTCSTINRRTPTSSRLHAIDDDDDSNESIPPELLGLPKIPKSTGPNLGIDIKLDPLSEKEAAALKAAATEIVNDKIAEGIDDIEKLRTTLKKELAERQRLAAQKSAAQMELEGQKLLNKIDTLTNDFLESTLDSRRQTQLAAEADRRSEGQGVELGSWGTMGGSEVNLQDVNKASVKSGGLIILADDASDAFAKRLVDPLLGELKKLLKKDEIPRTSYKPTATVPLGGDNADTLLLFLTSYSDVSSVNAVLDRVLRRTLNGSVPTQIVAISTLGTERTEKMPYSMQNLMGGKLEKRRQMEEAVIQTVKRKDYPMDYTICKLGELDDKKAKEFTMNPGDAVDGPLSISTAAQVVSQAMLTRASARNATLSVVGSNPTEAELDDAFLRLDGPEVYRQDELADYDTLVEYVMEWSDQLASTGKGLTTPVQSNVVSVVHAAPGIKVAEATQLLFLPTATGRNYMSREEEREREKQLKSGGTVKAMPSQKIKQDGGLEFIVEQMTNGLGRVRAKRCNYGDGAVVKELSEQTILSSFKKSMEVWRREHPL